MGQVNVYLAGVQLQVHRGHIPGAFQAQNPPVKLTIIHGYWMAAPPDPLHVRRLDRI
jgi:hypothetical protein